uniref:Uncharacterized protein n=1 Tax=Octopus bimaculoides TaxID=37653 RepID=A0A0L8IHS8_OCTBM
MLDGGRSVSLDGGRRKKKTTDILEEKITGVEMREKKKKKYDEGLIEAMKHGDLIRQIKSVCLCVCERRERKGERGSVFLTSLAPCSSFTIQWSSADIKRTVRN